MSTPKTELKLDELYVILEKHLYEFEEKENTYEEFIDRIIREYLRFLSQHKVIVPRRWQEAVIEELREQVKMMLLKKMYGCLSITEYVKKIQTQTIKRKTIRKTNSNNKS